MTERFHVLISTTCNNNCLFCMEHRWDLTERQQSPEHIRQALETHAASGEVMFAFGEPTLHPRLPEFVAWARELGYRRIGLTTNGRRLGYEAYTRRLLESGLNHLVVSVHGPDARSHDGQTRTPGSFDQAIAGLRVATGLRAAHPFTLHSSTVVSRRNLHQLSAVLALLQPFRFDQHIFNVTQPLGRAAPIAKQLLARYTDVATAFGALLTTLPTPRPKLYLVDIPPCTTEGLPASVRGYVEAAFSETVARDGTLGVKRLQERKVAANAEKREGCGGCSYDGFCPGVWREYVRVHGWDEFVPVQRATGRVGAPSPS